MSLPVVTPEQARALLAQGKTLIDIRQHADWLREHIPEAHSVPLDALANAAMFADKDVVIFHCQSGMRTENNATSLAAAVQPAQAMLMQGGINAWKAAGLPTVVDKRQPLPLMRQVQITAGCLVLAGTLLGLIVSPGFFVVPAFVGAGLMFAGISGWCGMAKLLAVMPWNKNASL